MGERAGWWALTVLLVLGCSARAPAQSAESGQRAELEQILKQRYQLTSVGKGLLGISGSAAAIRRAGVILAVRREGFYGSLDPTEPASMAVRGQTVEVFRGHKDYALPVGERCYVYSVYVGSDVVSLGLLTTRVISTRKGNGRLWASGNFFFPPETLAKADTDAVFRVIEQWLLTEGESPLGAALSAERPVPPRTELKAGMTREEVIAALGSPQSEVSFGARTWLSYFGLTVLLENGRLSSVDASAQPTARVSFASEPAGAEIYLDGNLVGSTPTTLELPAATYPIRMRLPDHQDWERNLRVLAGSDVTLRAVLEKK